MPKWIFRLSGQFPSPPDYQRAFQAARVSGGDSHGRKVLWLFDSKGEAIIAEFSTAAVFGYMKEGKSVRVWFRVPSTTDECQLRLQANVVKDGLLNGIQTIDLLESSSEAAKPLGRLIADWVLAYAEEETAAPPPPAPPVRDQADS